MMGLGGDAPKWVSELAEELASLCEMGIDPGTLSGIVRERAKAMGWDPWPLTNMVVREWDRLGIRRVPLTLGAGGW